MFGALSRLFGNNKSGSVARNRLQFVLVQDRAGLTNEEMAEFKRELVDVIDKYFVIDEEGFDIDYEREGEATTLVINSPVIVKRQAADNGIAGARHTEPGAKRGTRKQRKAQRGKTQRTQQAANSV